ncbi:T-cell leukemia/lymphoma protein 1A [Microcebus murinus]|uniref:TCL1 family AKT coactivator A n=1 Tax=Microcebus murinus TaxID=30608 RepID=A0A8B7I6C5_MICMU|nr:T-cell leukemia/lymphoma protein 1A [Microcebus murinus]
MGEFRPCGVQPTLYPDRLWIWEKAVYMDENRRTWLSIIIETEDELQVLLRQKDVPLGEPLRPSQLLPGLLPLMWQLYPGERYRGSDSSFWRIVYHVKLSDTEDLLLEKLASE